MLARAIENWLTNTNERNYQTPFCQVLLSKGHSILYVSTHGQLEQGKDIITISPNGEYCAYQLKTGNINLAEWRKIKGEIQELIELPIVHPSVEKGAIHKSFLITNGTFTDPVRRYIDDMNQDNVLRERKYSKLETISLQELLELFQSVQDKFIPIKFENFQMFLKFYLADGCGMLNKREFCKFLEKTIFEVQLRGASNIRNAISSSVILTAYTTHTFQQSDNHFAQFEAWACLLSYLIRFKSKCKKGEPLLEQTLSLVFNEASNRLYLLKEEVKSRDNFLEGSLVGDGGLMYEIRRSLVLGAICALEVCNFVKDESYSIDPEVIQLVRKNLNMEFWGEYI